MREKVRKNLELYRRIAREGQRRARARVRATIDRIKVSKGCRHCSEKHPACLQFHHKNPKSKKFTIAHAISKKIPLRKILIEIKKCVVLCANCHAKEHYNQRH